MPYQDAFQFLVDLGFLDVILPFVLVFIITYGVLQRTQILGQEKKKPKTRLNAMVAFVMGFFAVLAVNLLNVINIVLFYFVLLLVIGLCLALVFGLTGAEGGIRNRLFIAIMIVFIVLFFFYALAQAGVIDESRFFNTLFWPAIVIAVAALLIYFLFRKKTEAPAARPAARPAERPQQAGPPQPSAEEEGGENPFAGLTPDEAQIMRRAGEIIQRRRGR